MNHKNFQEKTILATTTLYSPNKSDLVRAELSKSFIAHAASSGYEIIIVDGGSYDSLSSDFSNLGAKVYSQSENGMGKGRREAMKYAYETGKEIVIWTEPEKESFIHEIPKTIKPILENRADIVVPKRKSLSSYPKAQQYSEPLGNLIFKELTGYDLDIFFGPKVFRRDMVPYFLDYKGDYGDLWDSIQIPIMNAIFNKERVLGIVVNYSHPKEQTKVEESDIGFYRKRIEQLVNQMNALETHWKNLKN